MGIISEKVAYLRRLADGLNVENSENGRVIKAIIDALDAIAVSVEEHDEIFDEIDETFDEIDKAFDDIDDRFEEIEDYLCEEDEDECDGECDDCDDFDDCCGFDDDDDFYEIECPKCNETVYFDKTMLESDEDLICPNCNARIFPEDEEEIKE